MTEDNWKKKYEEALERMKYVVVVPANEAALQAVKETVFPELRKSEEEKIIEELIEYLTVTRQIDFVSRPDRQRWITWLNKCKDSLHISETCKENENSFTNKEYYGN